MELIEPQKAFDVLFGSLNVQKKREHTVNKGGEEKEGKGSFVRDKNKKKSYRT